MPGTAHKIYASFKLFPRHEFLTYINIIKHVKLKQKVFDSLLRMCYGKGKLFRLRTVKQGKEVNTATIPFPFQSNIIIKAQPTDRAM